MLAVLLTTSPVTAYDFKVGDLCYFIDYATGSAIVVYEGTGYNGYGYSNLSGDIVIPSSVPYYGTNRTVVSIYKYTFMGCTDITSVEISDSVNSIGTHAFAGCDGIKSITIGKNVRTFGDFSFYGCNNVINLIWNAVNCNGGLPYNNVEYVTIGDEVELLPQDFVSCSKISSIYIPSSVTSIGNNAFYDCKNLSRIVVESGNSKYDSRNNCNAIIESLNNSLILGCENTIIPNTVSSIGRSAFCNCTGLTSIDIPNSVTSIGWLAFSGCTELTSAKIGNSVTTIGNDAFGSTNLKTVTIPNSVTFIGEQAFSNCPNLESATIGSSVSSIGSSAFNNCTSITSIYSKIQDPQNVNYGQYIFYKVNKVICKLYVPKGTKSLYQNTYPWNEFVNIIEVSDIVGDVNNDNSVNSTDITVLYNYLLNGEHAYSVSGDVNGDGSITAADVTAVYNILLGQ